MKIYYIHGDQCGTGVRVASFVAESPPEQHTDLPSQPDRDVAEMVAAFPLSCLDEVAVRPNRPYYTER